MKKISQTKSEVKKKLPWGPQKKLCDHECPSKRRNVGYHFRKRFEGDKIVECFRH